MISYSQDTISQDRIYLTISILLSFPTETELADNIIFPLEDLYSIKEHKSARALKWKSIKEHKVHEHKVHEHKSAWKSICDL